MFAIIDTSKVCMLIAESIENTPQGLWVNRGAIDAQGNAIDQIWVNDGNLTIVPVDNIPEDFVGGKYCYDNGFYTNQAYAEPTDIFLQLSALQADNEMLKTALAELTMIMANMTGGGIG